MKKLIGVVLVVLGIVAVVYGVIEYEESKELLEIGELEIEAGEGNPGTNVWLYLIGGLIAALAGWTIWRRG